jgi:hypothetical protein
VKESARIVPGKDKRSSLRCCKDGAVFLTGTAGGPYRITLLVSDILFLTHQSQTASSFRQITANKFIHNSNLNFFNSYSRQKQKFIFKLLLIKYFAKTTSVAIYGGLMQIVLVIHFCALCITFKKYKIFRYDYFLCYLQREYNGFV